MDVEKRAILLKQAQAQAASAQSSTATAGDAGKKPVEILGRNQVDLTTTLDQSYTGTVPVLSDKEIIDIEAVYEDRMEGPCPPEQMPSDHQLTV